MEKHCADLQRWALFNNSAVELQQKEEKEEDDDEEALSLSDLPFIHQCSKVKDEEEESSCRPREIKIQEDFDFCSLSKESEMCAADEVFFQGQILPLRRHSSASSDKGLLLQHSDSRRRSISRSESMDHYYSGGGFISSRSSSMSSSHQSMSSSSGGSSAAAGPKYKSKLPPRNQFHSHPSPSPKLRFPSNRQRINHRNCTKKSSSMWNVFRLGLVAAPPEIAFHDLKTRCPSNNTFNSNGTNFGSRNSTSSSISSNTNNKRKIKPRGLLGGCKCSVDAVDTVSSRVVIIRRSASESDMEEALQLERENSSNVAEMKPTKKQAAKKYLSHHRTFEWLKQLSLEGSADDA